jgi:hypothetical protein
MGCGIGSQNFLKSFIADPATKVWKCLKCACQNEYAVEKQIRCTTGMIERHLRFLPPEAGVTIDYRKCDAANNPIDGTDVRFASDNPNPPVTANPPCGQSPACKALKGAERLKCISDCKAARVANAGTLSPPRPPTTYEQQTTNYLGVISDVVSGLVGANNQTNLKLNDVATRLDTPKPFSFSLTTPDGEPNWLVLALLAVGGYFAWRWLK